jgi:hypothetical protein
MKSPPVRHFILFHLMLAGCSSAGDDSSAPMPRFEGPKGSIQPARIAVAPAEVDVGEVVVGSRPGKNAVFTVTNRGDGVTGSLQLTVVGSAFVMLDSTCANALAPLQSCAVTVAFRPTAPGPVSGTLSVSALPGGNQLAGLRGMGVERTDFVLTPLPPFEAMVNTTSPPSTITITNGGQLTTGPMTASLKGKDLVDFTIVGGTCGFPLAPRAACTIEVVFKPTVAGTRTAELVVDADPGGVARATLAGEARL